MIRQAIVGWDRDTVVGYAAGKKVIDIGGAMAQWLEPKPMACLDIQKGSCEVNFQGDINMPQGWKAVLDYVNTHGKFDFSICTHVLEDVRNPPMVLDMLPLVANEGFISMPCKRTELQPQECDHEDTMKQMGTRRLYRGYIHHRWIFSVKSNTLWMFPKLPVIEVMDNLEWVEPHTIQELSFFWEGGIPYKIFQDDWLGPNPWKMVENYRKEIQEGL